MVSLTARSRLSTIIPVRRILLRPAVLITLAAMLGGHMTVTSADLERVPGRNSLCI